MPSVNAMLGGINSSRRVGSNFGGKKLERGYSSRRVEYGLGETKHQKITLLGEMSKASERQSYSSRRDEYGLGETKLALLGEMSKASERLNLGSIQCPMFTNRILMS